MAREEVINIQVGKHTLSSFCPRREMVVGGEYGITDREGEGSLGSGVVKRCETEINTHRKPAGERSSPRGVFSSFLRSQGSRAVPSTDILSEST